MKTNIINNNQYLKVINFILDNYNNSYNIDEITLNNQELRQLNNEGYFIRDYQNRDETFIKVGNNYYSYEGGYNDETRANLIDVIDEINTTLNKYKY